MYRYFIYIIGGSSIGVAARYLYQEVVQNIFPSFTPLSTLSLTVVGSTEQINQQPPFESLVFAEYINSIVGANVLKVIMSCVVSSLIHTAKLFDISVYMRIVAEIVDFEARIKDSVSIVNGRVQEADCGGLITIGKGGALL